VILGSIKGAFFERCAAIDRGLTSCADLELGELVKLDLYSVIRVSLALRLRLPRLKVY
jgi:hypothetical protein